MQLAMLIESTRIRELLNTTVYDAALSHPSHAYNDEERGALEAPKQYEFSINPIPALVILLLGIMMSSHTQQTMISSMVHKQWGNLLTGASFARGFSYVLLYLKPPRSILPSRPPTELLTAFGLIAGGTIFMASVCFSPVPGVGPLSLTMTTVQRYNRWYDPLRPRRHVLLHSDHGIRRSHYGLGCDCPGPQGLGRSQGVRPSSQVLDISFQGLSNKLFHNLPLTNSLKF